MKARISAFIIVAALGSLTVQAQTRTAFVSETPRSAESGFLESERQIHSLINRERISRKLGMLVWDDQLAQIARSYSRQMASENFFDHYDSKGLSIEERAYFANIRSWKKIGENLFYVGNEDRYSALAVRMWMESDSHRENVLDRTWTSTGIGISRAANGRVYVTQVFMAD